MSKKTDGKAASRDKKKPKIAVIIICAVVAAALISGGLFMLGVFTPGAISGRYEYICDGDDNINLEYFFDGLFYFEFAKSGKVTANLLEDHGIYETYRIYTGTYKKETDTRYLLSFTEPKKRSFKVIIDGDCLTSLDKKHQLSKFYLVKKSKPEAETISGKFVPHDEESRIKYLFSDLFFEFAENGKIVARLPDSERIMAGNYTKDGDKLSVDFIKPTAKHVDAEIKDGKFLFEDITFGDEASLPNTNLSVRYYLSGHDYVLRGIIDGINVTQGFDYDVGEYLEFFKDGSVNCAWFDFDSEKPDADSWFGYELGTIVRKGRYHREGNSFYVSVSYEEPREDGFLTRTKEWALTIISESVLEGSSMGSLVQLTNYDAIELEPIVGKYELTKAVLKKNRENGEEIRNILSDYKAMAIEFFEDGNCNIHCGEKKYDGIYRKNGKEVRLSRSVSVMLFDSGFWFTEFIIDGDNFIVHCMPPMRFMIGRDFDDWSEIAELTFTLQR